MKHELPKGHKVNEFGELFSIEKKSKKKASEGTDTGKFKFFTSSNLQTKFIDDFDFEGEFLIFGTGGNASIHYVKDKFSTSTDCLIAKINDNSIIAKYVYYYLVSKMYLLEAGFKGAGLKHISKGYIQKIKIPYPENKETQHKIVAILEKAEETKKLRAQADELSQQLLQSVFLEMFGEPRLMYKLKSPRTKLKNIIQIIVPTRDKPQKFTGNIPWITLPDLSNSIYVEEAKLKLSKEEAKPTKCRLFPEKTVILSCAGSLGKVAIAKKEVYTNQQFYGLVCDETKIVPEFLAYHLRFFGDDFYTSISGTSTLAFFKKDSALNIEVMLPDVSKQIYFSEIVKQVEKTKQLQHQSSQEINTLFNSLMQKAFTGELVA